MSKSKITPLLPIKPIWLFWPCLLFCLSGRLLASPIIIKNTDSYNFSKDSWSYLAVTHPDASIASIQREYQQQHFRPVGRSVYNGGIASQYLWFHFTVSNEDSVRAAIVIDVESPRINELELFEKDDSDIRSLGRLGDFFPFGQRKIIHKNFIYNSYLDPGVSREYFLYVNQVGHTLILPVRIYKSRIFPSVSFRNYLIDGVTYGILLFVSVLGLLFFLSTRHSLYLFYGLYILSAIAWFLSYFGLGYQYLWGDYPRLSTVSAPFFASMNLVLNIQICQILLRLKKIDTAMYRAGNLAKLLLGLAGLFPVFVDLNKYGYAIDHTYLAVFLTIVLASVLAVIVPVLSYSIKGSTVAQVYLISSLLKISSIINLALLELGITPGLYNLEGLLQTGILIEISMLTFAIAQRYTIYKLRSFKQVIAAQEAERENISKEIHDSVSNTLTGVRYALLNMKATEVTASPAARESLHIIEKKIEQVQKEARQISHYMMPDYILRWPLAEIVKRYISDLKENGVEKDTSTPSPGINFSTNEQQVQLSQSVTLNIFRIIQELIANINKHSKASSAEIVLSFGKKSLLIISEDNGVGFPINGTDAAGIGISNIRSRVKTLNGSFNIRPMTTENEEVVFCGTNITIRIPFYSNAHQKAFAYDY